MVQDMSCYKLGTINMNEFSFSNNLYPYKREKPPKLQIKSD